jgi:hypothetical protein
MPRDISKFTNDDLEDCPRVKLLPPSAPREYQDEEDNGDGDEDRGVHK